MRGPPPPKKTSTRQNLDFIGFYSFFSVRKNVRSRQNPSGKRQVRFGAVRGWATARAPTRRWGRRGDAETRRKTGGEDDWAQGDTYPSPGCHSVPNPLSIEDYDGFRVYQGRTQGVPNCTRVYHSEWFMEPELIGLHLISAVAWLPPALRFVETSWRDKPARQVRCTRLPSSTLQHPPGPSATYRADSGGCGGVENARATGSTKCRVGGWSGGVLECCPVAAC